VSWTEKPEQCDACGWETKELTEYDAYARTPGHGPLTPEEEKQRSWQCIVCASTHCGTIACYPRNQHENVDMIRTLCWGINYLASLIKR